MASGGRSTSAASKKYFSDLDTTGALDVSISGCARRSADLIPAQRKAWLQQTISLTSLVLDYTSQVEERANVCREKYEKARDRDLNYTTQLYEQYYKIKEEPKPGSNQVEYSGASEILDQWEQRLGETNNAEEEIVKAHLKKLSVLERFRDENPIIYSGALDDSISESSLVSNESLVNSRGMFINGFDMGNDAVVDKITKTFVAQLLKYREAIDRLSTLSDNLKISEQLLLAERLRGAQMRKYLECKVSGDAVESKSAVTNGDDQLKKQCESVFTDQEQILEKCHSILSSMKESGGKLQTCTKDLTTKTKCLLDCCTKLDEYKSKWADATSMYTTSDPVSYVKKNYDIKNCLNMSLKDHDKRLKSLKKLLERQSAEHSRNVQQILSQWKEYYESQNSEEGTVAVTEESLNKFIEDCRANFDEKTTAVKKMKEESEKNCRKLAESIKKIYQLGDNNHNDSDKMIEFKKLDQSSHPQLDDFYLDYAENIERYRQSFDIISQSADLYLKYLSNFEKRVTSYNSAESKLKSGSTTLIKELEKAERLESELKDGRALIQSMESDLYGRKEKVDKVKNIFLALKNVEDRCTAVMNETTEKRKEVDNYLDRLTSCLKSAQDKTKHHVELIQRWGVQTTESKLIRLLTSIENEEFINVLKQHHANKSGGLDYCKSLLENQQETLREAAIHNSAKCAEFLEELSNLSKNDSQNKTSLPAGVADHVKVLSQWQEYITAKRRSFPLIEEVISKKFESIAELFPQVTASRRMRPLEDRNASSTTAEDMDKFYSDRFSRKAKDIQSQLTQAKRVVEELSSVVEQCSDISKALSKCDEETKTVHDDINAASVNSYLEESRKRIASACCALNELRKMYTDQQKASGGLKELSTRLQKATEGSKVLTTDVDGAVEELRDRCGRMERLNKDFETSYRSQEKNIVKLNLDKHQQRVLSIAKEIEEKNKGRTSYSRRCLDDQTKWIKDCRIRVQEYATTNASLRQQLEELLDQACRECNEREMERINTSGLDRYTDDREIFPDEYTKKLKSLTVEYESLFNDVTMVCPVIRRRSNPADNTYKHYIEQNGATGMLDHQVEEIVKKADELQKAIRNISQVKIKELQESFEESERERIRLGELREKVTDSGISRDFDRYRQDLMELERRLKACLDLLDKMNAELSTATEEIANFDEADVKRLEAIERIISASSAYERLGMIQPTSRLYDRYTKADISRAFREQSKLVHPDKCRLPGAEQASRLLSEAKIELQEKYRYRP